MGIAYNIGFSIPIAIIIYLLSEKVITHLTYDDSLDVKIQKNFVIGFLFGLVYFLLGMTVFSEGSDIANDTLKYSFYLSGLFLIINAVIINWDILNEETKMVILGLAFVGSVVLSYKM